MQTKKTAPLEFTNNTQQELRLITSLTKSNYKLSECSVRWPARPAVPIAIGMIFFRNPSDYLFASRQKEKCSDFYSEITTSVSSFLFVKDWLNENPLLTGTRYLILHIHLKFADF